MKATNKKAEISNSQAYQQSEALQRVWKEYLNKKCECGDLVKA